VPKEDIWIGQLKNAILSTCRESPDTKADMHQTKQLHMGAKDVLTKLSSLYSIIAGMLQEAKNRVHGWRTRYKKP
jgi:hypothetical protein